MVESGGLVATSQRQVPLTPDQVAVSLLANHQYPAIGKLATDGTGEGAIWRKAATPARQP